MQIQAIPVFKEGGLLMQSMLQALSDHAFLANQLLYKEYGNGILSGCELTTTKDSIVLNTGVIYYEGQMFLIKEPMEVNYHPTNTTTILKIHFSNEIWDSNFVYREINVLLTGDAELQKDEIELCRFKLQDGARLRHEYQDFEDWDTEFDTLNVIHAAYAAKGGSTLAPEILRAYASELLELDQLSDLDTFFCIQVMGQERAMPKMAVTTYLKRRNKMNLKDDSNYAIYKELVKIIHLDKKGLKPVTGTPTKKIWKMMID